MFFCAKMKKLFLISTAAPILTFCYMSEACAFHDGGVGNCDGCHTIHNSSGGIPEAVSPGRWLLKGMDPGSICLNCHAGPGSVMQPYVASADGSALTPGGDFYWLTKTFSWSTGTSPGYSHGHNIVALDYGYAADSVRLQAPGGTYPSADLTCTSCHDPHGRARGAGTGASTLPISGSGSYGDMPTPVTRLGTYRLLGSIGYNGGSHVQGYSFSNRAPIATQNEAEPFGESDASHVAYGSGMSEWCVNCHASYITLNHSQFVHPSGDGVRLLGKMTNDYNAYVRTGDLSGNGATAYLQFVPFEQGETDASLLDPTSTQGANSKSRVMCLTCHRAHASAFRAIGRWDFDATLLAVSHPAQSDAGVSGNDILYSYYGRNIGAEFGAWQQSFCEKCHGVAVP
jgi:hypothetical protein